MLSRHFTTSQVHMMKIDLDYTRMGSKYLRLLEYVLMIVIIVISVALLSLAAKGHHFGCGLQR